MTSSAGISLADLRAMKKAREPIACLTAYDAAFARLEDRAGVDLVLVGDSLGMVVQGHGTTVAVTMDDVVYHCRCVGRAIEHALLVADMPFMSCTSVERALHNARRLMQEGGVQVVKIEVGALEFDVIEVLDNCKVPVCAHIGLRPQMVHKLGRLQVQGEDAESADELLRQAVECADKGADMILVELVPQALARRIRDAVAVPVIGIGAGPHCDGQILVMHDVLGVSREMPRFAKNFLAGADTVEVAFRDYVGAVKSGAFPPPQTP